MAQTEISDLKQRFLEGMSFAACTVNIVATDGPAGRSGVTVSAMSSVSADTEKPTLLVCVHQQGSAAAPIFENEVFSVNILRDDQAHISNRFAGRLKEGEDKFDGAKWISGKTGAPVLDEGLVSFDCRLSKEILVGTHHVFFGEVQDVHLPEDGRPLVYANRGYATAYKHTRSVLPATQTEDAKSESLSVACLDTIGSFLLPGLLKKIQDTAPALEMKLSEGPQDSVLDQLKERSADISIMYDIDLDDSFDSTPIMDLVPYLLFAESHPLAGKDDLSLDDLADQLMVMLNAPVGRDYFLSLLGDQKPNIAFESTSFEMVRGLVAQGLGYTIMVTKPVSNLSYDGQPLVARPLPGNPDSLKVSAVCHKADLDKETIRSFLAICEG